MAQNTGPTQGIIRLIQVTLKSANRHESPPLSGCANKSQRLYACFISIEELDAGSPKAASFTSRGAVVGGAVVLGVFGGGGAAEVLKDLDVFLGPVAG